MRCIRAPQARRSPGLLKQAATRADTALAMDLTRLLQQAVDGGASDLHLKLGRKPIVRHDGAISELGEHCAPSATRSSSSSSRSLTASRPDRREAFARAASSTSATRTRACASASTPSGSAAPSPSSSASSRTRRRPSPGLAMPARRDAARRGAPRPHPRHRRNRVREVDHARRDGRSHQPHAQRAHHHDRGPDRDAPLRPHAASSTSARSASTPPRSPRRFAVRCARTRT